MAIPIEQASDLRGIDRETKALLIVCLETDGWRVVRTAGSHFQVFPPRPSGGQPGERGRIVTVHGTASDHRTLKNTRADLRRAGLEI
jgi:predicted RNA binding protein YcfA (HicA-like mRNA interferase family)